LFTGLTSLSAIVPVSLNTKTAGSQIPVTAGAGPWYATSLVAVPGQPNSVTALLTPVDGGNDPRRSITVYDGAVPRPKSFTGPDGNLIYLHGIFPGDGPNSLFGMHIIDPFFQYIYRFTI